MNSEHAITSLPTTNLPALVEEPANPAREIQQFVEGAMQTIMAPDDARDIIVAKATLAFVLALPKFPAARLFGDLVFGWPHAHGHPPNFIPPAPPIPLPSIGPVICSGSVNVLINRLPAARCGDIGFGAWCGGFFPFFEVQTGSSHVFIGGARAARQLIDFTRHCIPDTPGLGRLGTAMMAFSVGMGALEEEASLTDMKHAAADAASAETEAAAAAAAAAATAAGIGAAMAAAQTAADLATAALQAGMGRDPAIPPGIPLGNFITGSHNVIIGGFPMPGRMPTLGGLGKLLKRELHRLGQRNPQLRGLAEVGDGAKTPDEQKAGTLEKGADIEGDLGRPAISPRALEAAKQQTCDRVAKMKEAMTDGERGWTTFAVAEVLTAEGDLEVWVSAAGALGDVPDRIADAADGDPISHSIPNVDKSTRLNDAERAILREADDENAIIVSIGATRIMCEHCETAVREAGYGDRIATQTKSCSVE